MKIGLIVEGHGEVVAAPILVRRLTQWIAPTVHPEVLLPHRIPRGQLVKEDELRRAIELTARKVGDDGLILVLLDADKDLPCVLGPRLLTWARSQRSNRTISVVVAQCEYEAWFLAAAESLRGQRGLRSDLRAPSEPERIRDAKGWLGSHMPQAYSETLDQPALTSVFDLEAARRADSFDKLVRDMGTLLGIPAPPRP
ncbi:DUF4276 family protein [Corallococcus exiguus]|uniref:DUF4276 family protein n=1 Tax=Corallococcus TaxID=83461 RepID=UPI000EC93C94|nr:MULTISPECIES: DUF4276 family protein [Corallococcus]NNC20017.1 DUF4276 family protein [Corallococcus exiguus]NRD65954.1 DUF4276 family protein [Corallococcus exiguus]RKH97254.1 DUF4276 family protein [Corallococcus sp. AB030]